MCAIIEWRGMLPKANKGDTGLLSRLFLEAEHRGHDSTGVAYRKPGLAATNVAPATLDQTMVYRRACAATKFVRDQQREMGEARRSTLGIGHVRRASPGMPVDNLNAHPFTHGALIFAHNGHITNWKALQAQAIENLEKEAPSNKRQKYLTEAQNYKTDSQVLGRYIRDRDFEPVLGCMGLVWLYRGVGYCFRSAKELAATTLVWQYKEGEDFEQHTVTIVASTPKIIESAINKCQSFKIISVTQHILEENTVYRVEVTGVVSEGKVPVNAANKPDTFTSAEDKEKKEEVVVTTLHQPVESFVD